MKIPEWCLAAIAFLLVATVSLSVVWGIAYHSLKGSPDIAPAYALDCYYVNVDGNFEMCSHVENIPTNSLTPFGKFWNEATKNTQFTVDGKTVEITDVQISYRVRDTSRWQEHYNASWGTWTTIYFYSYGNITYYPSGIENSQTYVAPIPTPTPILAFPYEFCANGCVICTDHLGNCTYIPGRTEPTPTSTP